MKLQPASCPFVTSCCRREGDLSSAQAAQRARLNRMVQRLKVNTRPESFAPREASSIRLRLSEVRAM